MTKQELIEQRKQQLLAQNYTADAAQAEAERLYDAYEEEATPADVKPAKAPKKAAVEAAVDEKGDE